MNILLNRSFKPLLAICLLVLFGCEKEESFHSDEKAITKTVTLNDLPFIKKSIDEEKNKQSNKDSDINYLDVIIGDEILQITENGTNSYTFALSIEEPENQLTNLLIVEEADSFQYYLVIYHSRNMPAWKEELSAHRLPSVEATIEIRSLSDNKQRYAVYTSGCTVNETSFTCPSGIHSDNSGTDCIYERSSWSFKITKMSVPCGREEGGGGGGGGGSTGPVVPPYDHAGALKKITLNQNILSKINDLRTRCTMPSQLTEDGAQYIKSGNSYTERLPSFRSGDETRFDPDFVSNVEVALHMHQRQTYFTSNVQAPELVNIIPVFSDGDIAAFLGLGDFTNFANQNITAILVSPAGTFALRMGDKDKMSVANALLNLESRENNGELIGSADMKKLMDEYNDKIRTPCGDLDDACFKANFKKFIKTFTLSNGQSLGILLFEATFDANGNITNWVQQ